MCGHGCRFGGVWCAIQNQVQLQLPAGLNDALGAIRIAFAGQLNDDFVISLAVGSHERFRQAERVNTATDGFLGLVHGSLRNVSDVRRLHRKEIAGSLARGWSNIPVGELIGNDGAGRASLFRGNIVDQDLRVAQLANFIIPDGLIAKRFGDIVQDLIGLLADRFLYLYLQNQMRSALQVQAELDAAGEIRFQGGERLRRIRNSNEPDNTYENDGGDENCFPLEIGTHGLDWLRTPRVRAVLAPPDAGRAARQILRLRCIPWLGYSSLLSGWRAATADRNTFTFTWSAMRNWTASPSIPTMVPNRPPLVTTLSPFLRVFNISWVFFWRRCAGRINST